MRRCIKAVGVLFAALLIFVISAAAQNSAKSGKLTIEQLIGIKHPTDALWSPDGKHVVFTWDRAGVSNLYVANADGHGQPVALTSFPEGQVGGAFWMIREPSIFRTTAICGRCPLREAHRSRYGRRRRMNPTSFRLPTVRESLLFDAVPRFRKKLRTRVIWWCARWRMAARPSWRRIT
jgi:hypothetical protein